MEAFSRHHPALREEPVVVNYNFLRTRDLSHYENFNQYHATLHKNVEQVSLTPFSPRARDKALFGVLVSMTRLLEGRLAANPDADKFGPGLGYVDDARRHILDALTGRVKSVNDTEEEGTINDLKKIIKEWEDYASDSKPLHYSAPYGSKASGDVQYLIRSPESSSPGHKPVPNSLRDAEAAVRLRYMAEIQESQT